MSFSSFLLSKPARTISRNRLLLLLLVSALLLNALIFGWMIRHIYISKQAQESSRAQMRRITELQASVFQMSEILDTSVKMSAKTGDVSWTERYREIVPRLNEALRAAKAIAPNAEIEMAVARVDQANRELAELETGILEAARAERFAEVNALLSGDEYAARKQVYDEAVSAFENQIKDYERSQLIEANESQDKSLTAIILIFIISMGAWLSVIIALQKSRRNLLRHIDKRKRIGQSLKKSEARFRSMFENANDIVFTINLDGRFTLFNNEGEKLTGYSLKENPELGVKDLVAPECLALVRQMMKSKLGTNTSTRYETELVRKNGERIAVEVNSRVVYENGQPVSIQGIARDITERRRMTEALKKSEQYQNLFKHANDAILVIEPDTQKVLNVNDKACQLYGIESENFIGSNIKKVCRCNAQSELEMTKLLALGNCQEFETVHYSGNGTPLYLLINASPIEYEGNRAILSVIHDITNSKRIKEALQKNLSLLTSIFEATADGILVVDRNNAIVTFNRKFVEMWNLPEEIINDRKGEKVVAHACAMLKNPGDFARKVQESVEQPEVVNYSNLELLNGSIYERYTQPQILDGKIIGRVLSFRDITDRKRTEDALLRSQSALNATQDGVFMFSPDTLRFFYVNEGAIEQTGFSRQELLQMTPLDIKSSFTEKRFRRILARLAEGRLDSYSLTSVFKRRDGTDLPVEVILQYVTLGEGEDLFVAMVRDVSERHQAQNALQKNLSLLASTFEAVAEGILVVDLDNKMVACNRKYIEFFRIPEEILAGKDNWRATEYLKEQMENADEYIENTKKLIERPEIKSHDVLKFKNGAIFERFSHPHVMDERVVGRVISFRDITERTRAEEELENSQKRYQHLFDSNPYPIWVYDMETLQILAVNQEALRHYGYTQAEFQTLTLRDIRPPEDAPSLRDIISEAISKGETLSVARHQKKDGTIIDVEIASQAISFGGKAARLALITDITERKRAEAALRESEYKLRTLLESMNEGLVQVSSGKNQVIQFVNDRFCEMTGYTREELLGKATFDIFLDDEGQRTVRKVNEQRTRGVSSQYELRLRKKSGEIMWAIVGGAPIINAVGEVTATMGVFTDITERKLSEERLLHDALHDNLTGLANRKLFVTHLQKAIERGKRSSDCLYAVLFLDFDRFKAINDSLGHAAGDSLLKQIARRLEGSLRGGDLLARLGGDEFTVLLSELADHNDAIQVAERIKNDLNAPFMVGNQEIFMSASVGIALCSAGHQRAEDMLRDADIAMYRAKAKGKAQYQIFDQAMHKSAISKLQLETEMHHALQRGEFSLNYQPIVNLETNTLMGFEALIRWFHPERGMVLPSDFIPIAEENELVIPLGRWILYESCRQMRAWQQANPWAKGLTVSVNLSSKQFLQFDLYEQVAAALVSTQLEPHSLKLEITESHVMENSDKAVSVMHRLREMGVEISLDDFGTGYSSLSYLHRLPVNYLKIDRSFVSRMVESRENGEIVHTIVKLAQNLKMKVIAEGIENYEQLSQLKRLGCEYGQGYFFSQPLNNEAAADFIERQVKSPIILINQPIINAELNM